MVGLKTARVHQPQQSKMIATNPTNTATTLKKP
jgi:hypothetical protein